VLPLVVATQGEAVGAGAEQVDDRAGRGAAIDEIADADEGIVRGERDAVEQIAQLVPAAVDVADDDGAGHGALRRCPLLSSGPMVPRGQNSGQPSWGTWIDALTTELRRGSRRAGAGWDHR
jgi:hypothetical protein